MIDDAASSLSPIKQALLEIRALRKRNAELESAELRRNEPIAIVGMALRLPGGISTPQEFWALLESGGSLVGRVPPARWNPADGTPVAEKIYPQHGGFLDRVDHFDAEFFGVSPREAKSMDPQQRLLLELAWEALEDALIDVSSLGGTSAGVYLGLSNSDYGRMLMGDADAIDTYSALGGALSIAAGRVSHFLNLRGPSMVIDTACSSSLVALHLACSGLRSGEANLAIVGGANLMLLPEGSIAFSKTHMLAPDGQCKTFDDRADGYVRAEGCVCLILKRYSDAQSSGDRIRGLIAGSAINQDGRSATVTAPNGPAQAAVVREALRSARIDASDVSYVECHGTGTALGDPIEVQALASVFDAGRDAETPLRVGSVKANVGHLEAAAGLIGVVKVLLAFEQEALPAQINLQTGNRHIPWAEIPIQVSTERTAWKRSQNPRVAGVSAFGFSGTNAHAVLQEPPQAPELTRTNAREPYLLCISARTPSALHALAGRYLELLEDREISLADLCFSASVGRTHLSERLAVLASNLTEVRDRLRGWVESRSDARVLAGFNTDDGSDIKFSLSSEDLASAAEKADELRGLAGFDDAFERCMAAGQDLDPVVVRSFAVGYGLAQFYIACGVVPTLVTGDGVGAYVAASICGVLDFDDAIERACGLRYAGKLATLRAGEIPFAPSGLDASADFAALRPLDDLPHAARARKQITLNIGSSARSGQPSPIWESLMESLQVLYVGGVKLKWEAFFDQATARRISLPTYPFQRKSYWLDRFPLDRASPVQPVAAEQVGTEAELLLSLPVNARADWMRGYVRRSLQRVLQLDADEVLNERDRLTDLGMDSLVALELQGILARELDLVDKLPATIAYDAGTVGELARMLLELVCPLPAADSQAFDAAMPALSLDEISELSEEDVARMIAASAARQWGAASDGR